MLSLECLRNCTWSVSPMVWLMTQETPLAFVYAVHIHQPAARIRRSLARSGLDYPVAKAEVCLCVSERERNGEREVECPCHMIFSLMACDLSEEMCDYNWDYWQRWLRGVSEWLTLGDCGVKAYLWTVGKEMPSIPQKALFLSCVKFDLTVESNALSKHLPIFFPFNILKIAVHVHCVLTVSEDNKMPS